MEEKEDFRVPLGSSKDHLHIGHFSDNLSELHFNIMTDNLDLTFYNYCPNSYAFLPNMPAHAQAGVSARAGWGRRDVPSFLPALEGSVCSHAHRPRARIVPPQNKETSLPPKGVQNLGRTASTLRPALSVGTELALFGRQVEDSPVLVCPVTNLLIDAAQETAASRGFSGVATHEPRSLRSRGRGDTAVMHSTFAAACGENRIREPGPVADMRLRGKRELK